MASTKGNGFRLKGWLLLKRMAATIKEWFPQKGMASTRRMSSARGNGFHKNEWLPLKGMASTKRNGFH